MISKILIATFIVSSLTISSFGQTQSDKQKLDESYAKKELKKALSDSTAHNVIDSKTLLIKDKGTAINTVEPILFSVYGKDNITNQRPYEAYLIDNNWIISGTLPKGNLGGTFLIIVNATNSKILRLTHGK